MIRHSPCSGEVDTASPTRTCARTEPRIEPPMDASTRPPPPSRKHGPSDLRTAPIVELALRLGALALLIYVAVTLIQPFIEVVIWSIVIAVALSPAYERLADWLGGR